MRGDPVFSAYELKCVEQDIGGFVILPTKEDMERAAFREAVSQRDHYRCVACSAQAQDAHHLIERRLWEDGGYHLDNGVSLCAICHMKAEQTLLSVDVLRELADITKILLPETLERGHEYDKWGNIILPDGKRMRGPLFYDNSVQRVLEDVGLLQKFTEYVKYPRTPYLVWSPEIADEDLLTIDPDLEWEPDDIVVVTEKMDGENTTMYRNFIHARSLDSGYHESRTWVKNFHSKIAHEIDPDIRICGENMYAKHSIRYETLPSYFLGYSVWMHDTCLDWNETSDWFELLDIIPAPLLMKATWREVQKALPEFEKGDWTNREGYVIRIAESFSMQNFHKCVGKFVRENHVQTSNHWRHTKLEKNGLA